jgi:hypothetical protein
MCFFITFFSIRLFQFYAHGLAGLMGLPGLARIFFFFIAFLKNIFFSLSLPLILDCLVIELHSFIQFDFNELSPVSQPCHYHFLI